MRSYPCGCCAATATQAIHPLTTSISSNCGGWGGLPAGATTCTCSTSAATAALLRAGASHFPRHPPLAHPPVFQERVRVLRSQPMQHHRILLRVRARPLPAEAETPAVASATAAAACVGKFKQHPSIPVCRAEPRVCERAPAMPATHDWHPLFGLPVDHTPRCLSRRF
jgi:hypothetical protein